ncbi:MAG: hypothetical protein A3G52_02160 [Candidatus Taylorbacteria bacterium RIFCSPLOWO2_12_FULL_43_20]|uniref:Uncharacterized protein n=1 Tax=Candidatus Taylorbacteria bacterium RIFCSPLOWO2_12_FULL_43_20 TaxID=1802332 RepID=A0A1G2P4R2_9BACT|nr:MAG: hypothetical protein A2825_01045 [Candidatus Taylorbacteria bacterium RIFCSPHIGHO2_01_FULL_43_120]OHA23582.1 MAG: hypothetical protein A3B98_00490 [Candidatus Taylorbacteria bacterium RIFCSPHIGHO2_02_FULL_43_55]OHA28883.1 MAG: hypothetical protein A3E92_04385 [Candidatus Taylorbacteria bacterium RIFCSPHIGHO2_12_FULL_42_34]OHA30287.1 MAG: hypothetical protein A3B09_03960 [Candidatus Taylorbacteria bacterium RIFCSPLOWO2_01_FULL_43_83]OHA39339.1 MAG: hypothetical protein A3H58_04125 [Candi
MISLNFPELTSYNLWLIFGFVTLFLLFVSSVLIYHWRQYGMKNKNIIIAESIYLAGFFALLVLAFVSLILY